MDRARDEGEPRINGQIRVPRILLIDEAGNRLGEFMTQDALNLARERGLDLVEVAPNGRPPVCKIADYGRMRYERSKKEAAARKKQRGAGLKEIKVRPKTDVHDMGVKIRRARKFLSDGHKVKVRVWFRGREHAHHDIGADQCYRIADAVGEVGAMEASPRMEGRNMVMVLAPTGAQLDEAEQNEDLGEEEEDDFTEEEEMEESE